MRRQWTVIALVALLAVVALALLTACPKQQRGASQGQVQTAPQPQPVQPVAPPEAVEPPDEAAPEAAPEGEESAPEAPSGASSAVTFDGFQGLVFGMTKVEALANLPFNLKVEDGMEQPDFAMDGDTAYLFKVPYSEYPLLEPIEDAKAKTFGIAVGFWNGKFEYFSIITTPKHLGRAGWGNLVAKFNSDYGPPAGVSADEDGSTTITWLDAKGRAVSLVEPPPTDPDATYQITYQSDTWLALFAQ